MTHHDFGQDGLNGLRLNEEKSRITDQLTYEQFEERVIYCQAEKAFWLTQRDEHWGFYQTHNLGYQRYRASDTRYEEWVGTLAILMYSFPDYWKQFLEDAA